MKFSNRTVYDKARLIRFNNFIILKKRFFWAFMIVCTVFVLSSVALTHARGIYNSTILFCFALIILLDLTYLFCYLVLPRFAVNKAVALNTNILYEFQEDSFKISATNKNGIEYSELNYLSIIKIMASKCDIYLFLSKHQAYVLDRAGFETGCPDEFLEFLKDKNIPYKR